MKLDFIENYNEHSESIIRLYDFDRSEADLFHRAIKLIVIENRKNLDLTTLSFIESRNCYLTLCISDEDTGIISVDKLEFYCELTIEGYQRMLKLIEPFCNKESKAHQWLYDIDNPIDFLFSPAGSF